VRVPGVRRAVGVAAAAVALALPALAVGAGALPRLDHNGVTADAWTTVDSQPGNPAFGFGSVWVPSSGSGKLDRVDPKTLRVVAHIKSTSVVTPPPNQYFDSVALSKTAVWHASDVGNVVVKINPRANKVIAKIPVGGRPDEIAAGPAGVYVGLFNTATVERITTKVVEKRNLPGPVLGMAYGDGQLWALYNTTLAQLDPITLAVRKRISVKSMLPFVGGFAAAWWISADTKTICVGTLQQNAVTIVDPSTGKVTAQVALPFGRAPFSVAAANGKCWVTNDSGVFLVGADRAQPAYSHLPATGTSTFTGVAAGAGGAWVTLAGRNALLRVH
jgi:streptogramin lyase